MDKKILLKIITIAKWQDEFYKKVEELNKLVDGDKTIDYPLDIILDLLKVPTESDENSRDYFSDIFYEAIDKNYSPEKILELLEKEVRNIYGK